MEKKRKALRVIVAHPVPEEQQRLRELLEEDGFHVCYTTHDGLDCLRETLAEAPDLLILDMTLSKINGLEVLRQIKADPKSRIKCLVLTAYEDYIKDHILFLGADHCLIAPFTNQAFRENVRMLAAPPEAACSNRRIDAQTVRILQEFGVPDRLKAYPYVLHGVRILFRDPGLARRRCVVRELYGPISRHFGVPVAQVERTIRTLAARVFDKGDPRCLARYFSPMDLQQGHITNTDFLIALTRRVRAELTADGEAGNVTVR